MSLVLSGFRASMRAVLLDQSPPYLWTDDQLNLAIQAAVSLHSNLFPSQIRTKYDTVAGQDHQIPTVPVGSDLIAVQRVELPLGQPVPEDPRPTNTAGQSYAQAWFERGGAVYFRNALSGSEVGVAKLVIEQLNTWVLPDAGDVLIWNGPTSEASLVLLMAQLGAYNMLAVGQARDENPNAAKWNLPLILAQLNTQLQEAIRTRKARAVRSRTLDL